MVMKPLLSVFQSLCTQHKPSRDPRQSRTPMPGVIAHTLRWGHLQTTLCPVMLLRGPHNTILPSPTKTRPNNSSPSHPQSCDGTLNTSLVRPRVHQSYTRPSMCNHRHTRLSHRPDPQLISSPAGRRLNPTITSRSSPVQCPYTRRCRPVNRGRIRRPSRNPLHRINSPHDRWRRA